MCWFEKNSNLQFLSFQYACHCSKPFMYVNDLTEKISKIQISEKRMLHVCYDSIHTVYMINIIYK